MWPMKLHCSVGGSLILAMKRHYLYVPRPRPSHKQHEVVSNQRQGTKQEMLANPTHPLSKGYIYTSLTLAHPVCFLPVM